MSLLKFLEKKEPEPQPELVYLSNDSELDKAVEATLKKFDPNAKPDQSASEKKSSKSKEDTNNSSSTKKNTDDIEHEIKKRQVEKFQELLRDKVDALAF